MPDDYLNNLSYEIKAKEWQEKLFKENSGICMYVAESNDSNIIGFIAGSLEHSDSLFEGEILSFYIIKEYQGKGIGKLLLRTMFHRFVNENVKSIFLWTLQENPSRLFYEKMGDNMIKKRIINRGGKDLVQVSYEWNNISNYFID
jgi:Acetyltransferases